MNVAAPLGAFHRLAALGYGDRLIPIIPPGAPLSERSSLALGAAKGPDSDERGKAPGIRGRDGLWFGLSKWSTLQTTPELLREWSGIGAGAGLRTGDGLLGLDADVLDEALAEIVDEEVQRLWGAAPKRIGQAPKALYLLRLKGESGRIPPLRFGDNWQIEFSYTGKQFVAAGVHKKTRAPYVWARPLVPINDLPVATPEEIDAFVQRLAERLPAPQPRERVGEIVERGLVDQQALRGSTQDVRDALDAIPNDGRFDDRGAWLKMGYALRAALLDAPLEGLELFKAFSERWTSGANDEEYVENTWKSFGSGPFEIGAPWIFDQARIASGGVFRIEARRWFEEPEHPLASDDTSLWTTTPEPQRWTVQDWLPQGQTTLLSGDGGTGKSLIALQLAACMALGRDWMGKPVEGGRTLFITAEDEKDELRRRLWAILKHMGASPAELGGKLRIRSLHGEDAILAAQSLKDGLLHPTKLYGALLDTALIFRPQMIVLDTQADMFGGDENKRAHARQFIGLTQRLGLKANSTVLLLAHPSMSGMALKTGASGTTAWSNSVRSRLYLSRQISEKGEETDPDLRTLSTKKTNRARLGESTLLRYKNGVFCLTEEIAEGADVQSDQAVFLQALQRFNRNLNFVSMTRNSPRYAPRAFRADPEFASLSEDRLKDAMFGLVAEGRIEQEQYGKEARPQYRLVEREVVADPDKFW